MRLSNRKPKPRKSAGFVVASQDDFRQDGKLKPGVPFQTRPSVYSSVAPTIHYTHLKMDLTSFKSLINNKLVMIKPI